MKGTRQQMEGGREESKKSVCVCLGLCVLVVCIHVCLHVLCMSLQNLGEESLLILALGHNFSLSPSMDLHPSSASAEGHVVTR